MIVEILIILLIIIISIFIFLLIKPLDIHVIIQNNNLDYFAQLFVSILLINIYLYSKNSKLNLSIKIKLFSKEYQLFSREINSDEEDSIEEVSDEKIDENDSLDDDNSMINKIEKIYPELVEAKKDLFEVIYSLKDLCKFKESNIYINLGLSNNNFTIKFCTLLWSIFAPLYPLNCRLFLTPEINKRIVKSDININFQIFLRNIVKIIIMVLKRKNLRNLLLKLFQNR